jgi:alpha-glucosidase
MRRQYVTFDANWLMMAILLVIILLPFERVLAQVERFKFTSGNNYLIVEVLDDDLAHFELSPLGPGPAPTEAVFTTPQVFKTDYAGPTDVTQSGDGGSVLETPEMRIAVATDNLCVTLTDLARNTELTTLCPESLTSDLKTLSITSGSMQHVYGLGEQFIESSPDGDWTGRQRTPGDDFGNQMVGFGGGNYGNVMIPVMYAVGPNNANYALFLDHIYRQSWNFNTSPWRVETFGDRIRWYAMTGPDMPDLRTDYMELTGHPPVPPKKMFGLWVSEYGYENWNELEDKYNTLRSNEFPIDGFVLDLQWFGGITPNEDNSNMGRVSWDLSAFPDPAAKLASYRDNDGLGIITIEESYVSRGLPEHADLAGRGYLVRSGCATCAPVYLDGNSDKNNTNWWGKGGMIDWTLQVGADYWHDLKRQPLIEDGVIGHWIDLGEPEMYDAFDDPGDPSDWVAGVLPGKHRHADYHNAYNLKWAQSIARGYTRNNVQQRPFMMARSGAAGIQRHGVAMWSGDIGANLTDLAAHNNAQMHMSLSGIDYFGADVGGFQGRNNDTFDETYTQWFANAMMFDVPGRPHTDNRCNCKETAPDRVGDLASNRANVRERYALSPYLYSLAHQAYRQAEPYAAPLVYYYQNDPSVRERGAEKMLGPDLLVKAVARLGATQQDVYLPAGTWYDYWSNQRLQSTGQTFTAQPLYRNGLFRLPAYARAGAILPRMYVDEQTMNVLGKRVDGSTRNELILRVYPSAMPSAFTLFEDDGASIAYRDGAVRTTELSQQLTEGSTETVWTETVRVAPAEGSYDGAPASRDNVVELVGVAGSEVNLNGTALTEHADRTAFNTADSGWVNLNNGILLIKSGDMSVDEEKTFVATVTLSDGGVDKCFNFECRNGNTVFGTSVYVVGNIPELGNWDPAQAVKLDPNGPYPTWTGKICQLPDQTAVEWKCIKRPETASSPVEWEPGANNLFTSAQDDKTVIGDFSGEDCTTVTHEFVCDNGTTYLGQSVYVVGSVEALGNWDPAQAVKLEPTAYPRWTGTIGNLPPSTPIEWKCIKRPESASTPVDWEPDPNNAFTTPACGVGAPTYGNFQP